jgi:cytochrome c556
MKINKEITLLLILWFLPNVYANSNESKNNKPDDRVLLKIPYEDRENLTKVMRENLKNLGKMLNAMADDDFKSIQEIAEKMSFNKKKGKGLVRRGNSAFTAIGVQFHAVDTINVMEAAKTNDRKATLHAMANMVNTCVSCHSGFKVMEWPNNKVYNRPEPTELILPNGYKVSN